MYHFYTPLKRQKTFGFLTFLGGIEMGHWAKMGYLKISQMECDWRFYNLQCFHLSELSASFSRCQGEIFNPHND